MKDQFSWTVAWFFLVFIGLRVSDHPRSDWYCIAMALIAASAFSLFRAVLK